MTSREPTPRAPLRPETVPPDRRDGGADLLGTAVDVGGTHVTAATVDAGWRVRDEHRVPLDSAAPAAEVLDAVADCVRRTWAAGAATATGPVAVAIPGPFDYERGIGDFRGVDKFAALRGVDLRGELAARWGRAPVTVRFVNDAEAFGLGEWAAGAGSGAARVVAVTLGTGVGSAFVDRGRCVTTGPLVPADGNIHVVRVAGRPLEEVVSRRALRLTYRAGTGRDVDVVDIARHARAGDVAAVRALEGAMRTLAGALAPWLTAFAPERLVVGGSMAASSDLLFPPLVAGLAAAMARPPEVRVGVLPRERASLLGATVAARGAAEGSADGLVR
ncbi:ROK family protein [Promicromonospora sp. NPDC050880]|uniref:ROK family protein n=1 Tax=Promicromonospora sp. NPDC050880 TaxID=3364406 RepID=UPI00378B786E